MITQKKRDAQYELVPARYSKRDIDAGTLANEVSISNEENSQVFTVSVTNGNPVLAKDAANEISKVFKKEVVTMMNIKNVSVLSKAAVNTSPVSPNMKIFTLVGIVVGIMISFAWVVLREITDKAIKTVEFLTDEIKLIDLGGVNFIGNIDKNKKALKDNESNNHSRRKRRI